MTYAQSKPSPPTQTKQQSGCSSTGTFLRWSTNPALLEHSPAPGEVPRRAQVSSLERLTHPLMLLLWANKISITHAHIIVLLPISSLSLCGIWDTSKNVIFLTQTHKGITSTTHCTSFTYHNQDFQILANIISVTPCIIYEIDSIYILQEKNYIKRLCLAPLYLLEDLMMKHFKWNVTGSQIKRFNSTKTPHKTITKKWSFTDKYI